MFAIPQVMVVPTLPGVGAMTIDWPLLGAVLAWALIAALVGTGLGALRRLGASNPPTSRLRTSGPRPLSAPAHASTDCNHLEAA